MLGLVFHDAHIYVYEMIRSKCCSLKYRLDLIEKYDFMKGTRKFYYHLFILCILYSPPAEVKCKPSVGRFKLQGQWRAIFHTVNWTNKITLTHYYVKCHYMLHYFHNLFQILWFLCVSILLIWRDVWYFYIHTKEIFCLAFLSVFLSFMRNL